MAPHCLLLYWGYLFCRRTKSFQKKVFPLRMPCFIYGKRSEDKAVHHHQFFFFLVAGSCLETLQIAMYFPWSYSKDGIPILNIHKSTSEQIWSSYMTNQRNVPISWIKWETLICVQIMVTIVFHLVSLSCSNNDKYWRKG